MSQFTSALATLTLLLDAALIGALLVFIGRKMGKDLSFLEAYEKYIRENSYRLVLLIASVATAGSLFLSNSPYWIRVSASNLVHLVERPEIWTPCKLCWFQRIFMYPIVVLSATAIYLKKDDLRDYVMPLALIGIPISFYHAVIQRIQQFSSAGCSIMQVSCETKYTFHYGYITIPVMALTAFLAIAVILWRYDRG